MIYRPEIDGLRAVAVLIVLVFHINPAYLPGGFIGVDIFFVISGYLITNIVKKQIEEGSFRYLSFYTRRIKRLLPLFNAVVLFCLIGGYFVLFPNAYKQLGGDTLAANIFIANVKSSIHDSYFASDNIKPILHFWSLAVEEQFYFIMPPFFLICYKYCRKYIIHIFILLLILSLILSEVMSSIPKLSQFSYFLLPTRAWELLSGCILAVLKIKVGKRTASLFSVVGGLLILTGVLIINEKSVFPGFITLIPVLGAILIIVGGNNGMGKILSWKPIVLVGMASYSIYMWHWPIIIFLKSFFGIKIFNPFQSIILAIFIILLGFLSRRYIEDFFRFRKNTAFKSTFVYYLFLPFLITSIFAYSIRGANGFPSRFNVDSKYVVTTTVGCTGCFITKRSDENNKVLMIGDSHAEHFSNLFSKWFDDNDLSLQLFSAGGCNFYSKTFYTNACEKMKGNIEKELNNVKVVIVVKRFDRLYNDDKFLREYYDFVTKLTREGKTVILIKQVPKFMSSGFLEEWLMARRYGKDFNYNISDIDSSFLQANTKVLGLFKENKNVHILDFNNLLIAPGGGVCQI